MNGAERIAVANAAREFGREIRFPHQIVVRVPADLMAALRADADANGRTVAQSARFHLTHALPPGPVTPTAVERHHQ